jgi:hypothetical protein
MRNCALALLALALAVPGACQVVSDPPRQAVARDVEFMRGCWVAKAGPNGPVTAFLRLLPEGADGLSYQGYLQAVRNGEAQQAMHMSFARDGSSMTLRDPRGGPIMPMDQAGGLGRPYAPLPDAVAAKLPNAAHRASYAVYGASPTTPWFIADGGKDTLAIYAVGNTGQTMGDFFRGERDGCD